MKLGRICLLMGKMDHKEVSRKGWRRSRETGTVVAQTEQFPPLNWRGQAGTKKEGSVKLTTTGSKA